jgi:hypothetical protein
MGAGPVQQLLEQLLHRKRPGHHGLRDIGEAQVVVPGVLP